MRAKGPIDEEVGLKTELLLPATAGTISLVQKTSNFKLSPGLTPTRS